MPQTTIKYESKEAIPSALQPFANDQFEVSVWFGDKVAEETNPALEKNRNDILNEKNILEDKYKALISTSGQDTVKTANKIAELETKLRESKTLAPEDEKILTAVKSVQGVTVTEEYLKEALTGFNSVKTELDTIKKTNEISEFFKATGFQNEKAFQKAINDSDANPNLEKYYTKTEKVDGNDVVVAYAQVKGENGQTSEVRFDEYVKNNPEWANYSLGKQETTWLPAPVNPNNPVPPVNPTQPNTNPFLNAFEANQKKIAAEKAAQQQKQ